MSAHASSSRRRSDCYAEPPNSISPPVEEDAGDDQQRCHRQHVRECLRCCTLCGYLHAISSLYIVHDSSLRKNARNVGWILTRNTPRRCPLCESPLGVDRRFQDRPVMRRQLGSLMLLLRRTACNVKAITTKINDLR